VQGLLQLVRRQLGEEPQIGIRPGELDRLSRELVLGALAQQHWTELRGDRGQHIRPAVVLGSAMVGEEA
jgi:hypothetical protein